MKKKTIKKKLPKYELGTFKKIPKGYQPALGIGDATFETLLGLSVQPEVNAMRVNQIPNALNRLQLNAQYPLMALQSMTPATSLSGASAINAAGGASSLFAKGATPTVGGALNEAGLPTKIGMEAKNGSSFGSTLGTAGTVLAGLGTAYGLYNVGSDIANVGSHRTAADMDDTLSRSIYTTAGGNTYTTYGGPNRDAELAYERLNSLGKKVNLTLDLAGLGASAGSFFGPIGMGIGAGAGALIGGIGSLFGFGNNSDEVEEEMKMLADTVAGRNRMAQSVAESKDIESGRAANGKLPVWTPAGLSNKRATARVSNGEVIGNFEDGYVSRVPGKKNNKDTKLAALKSSDFVISNKYGLSDYAAATGDYVGALNMQNLIMNKKYKNGKLPGFENGWAEYALTSLPHFGSLMTNLLEYNRAKRASTYAPETYVDNAEGRAAVNELAQLRFDVYPYLRDAQTALNQANWGVRRNVGLGIGGRAVAQNANFASYLDSLRKIHTLENEANAGYRTAYANALANLGGTNQGRRMESLTRKYQWQQQANAAKENSMSKWLVGMQDSINKGAKDWLSMNQYRQSLDIQNKMLGLYQQQMDLDKLRVLNSLNGNKSVAASTAPIVETTPPSYIARPSDDDIYSRVFAMAPWRQTTTKPRSVDPYTNIYNLAPWH